MKTLVIVSHPDILNSTSQSFFLHWAKRQENVTIHQLETTYPNGQIDIKQEQSLLKEHDRILFQFPFYWYSTPPLLKHWQDEVLEEGFAHGRHGNMLAGKEFGLVMMIGVKKEEYQAGGSEGFSINELTKPFQAIALKTGMTYMKPLPIFQFAYMTDDEQIDVRIHYQQMLTMENNARLVTKEQWIINQLETILETLPVDKANTIQHIIDDIKHNRETISELGFTLDGM